VAFFLGRKGEKCLSISIGPRVFVRKVRRASSAFIWAGDFSGYRMPGTMKARWRWCEVGAKACLHASAASAMVDSSVGGSVCVVSFVFESQRPMPASFEV
jgi:hypothetical protein